MQYRFSYIFSCIDGLPAGWVGGNCIILGQEKEVILTKHPHNNITAL